MGSSANGRKVKHHRVGAWSGRKKRIKQRIGFIQESIQRDKDEFNARVAQLITESPECQELAERTEAAKGNLDRLNDRLDEILLYPKVTEHAMLRYCQRVLNIPVGQYARTLIPKEAVKWTKYPSGKIIVDGLYGTKYVVAYSDGYICSTWLPTDKELEELQTFTFTAAEAWRLLCEEKTKEAQI